MTDFTVFQPDGPSSSFPRPRDETCINVLCDTGCVEEERHNAKYCKVLASSTRNKYHGGVLADDADVPEEISQKACSVSLLPGYPELYKLYPTVVTSSSGTSQDISSHQSHYSRNFSSRNSGSGQGSAAFIFISSISDE